MNKSKLIAAGIVALASFGFFVMVLPAYNAILQARDDVTARRDRLQERTDLVAKVIKLDSQYQQYSDQINRLNVLIPEKKQVDQIVSSIQEISNQSGLNMTEIDVADLTSQSSVNYKSSIINLQLTGTYPQFINFLSLLEQSLRLYDVHDIVIGQSSGLQQKGLLNFQLKIYANNLN